MKELIRYQTDRNLDTELYDLTNEAANIFEELLEAGGLDVPKANRPKLRAALRNFTQTLIADGIAVSDGNRVSNYDQIDAFCDIITFSVGALLKLGHDPIKAIEECGKEINSRVGEMVDGKFEKTLTESARANWYKADYSKSVL